MTLEYKEKFIAFVDILGFKSMVAESEKGEGMSLPELLENLTILGDNEVASKYEKHGPTICPNSKKIDKDLNFKITQISDCVIVSSEVSPAGIINLIEHCWVAVLKLFNRGLMCRGYITKGLVYHDNSQVIGSGYQDAFRYEGEVSIFKQNKIENEGGTPFVEIDSAICDLITKDIEYKSIKEMYSRMVKSENGKTAIYPFQSLSHSFVIDEKMDIELEKKNNNNYRIGLKKLKRTIMKYINTENEKVVNKVSYYLNAIEDQLVICDDIDQIIDSMGKNVIDE